MDAERRLYFAFHKCHLWGGGGTTTDKMPFKISPQSQCKIKFISTFYETKVIKLETGFYIAYIGFQN